MGYGSGWNINSVTINPNDVRADPTSAVNAMSNAAAGIATPLQNALNAVDAKNRAARKEELERQKYAELLKQQTLHNGLAMKADDRAQFNAEAKGYRQGGKVVRTLQDVTSSTNALDNTEVIGKINDKYDSISSPRLNTLVAKMDSNGQLSSKEQEEYNKLSEMYDKNLGTVNSVIANMDTSALYKTRDTKGVTAALTKALVNNGVNPVYASKVATEQASNYLQKAVPNKIGAVDAERLKWLTNSIRDIKDSAATVKDTQGIVGKGGSKKPHYQFTQGSYAANIRSTAKKYGITPDWFTVDSGSYENKSGEVDTLDKSIRKMSVDVGNGKRIYATPDMINNAFAVATDNGTILGDPSASKKKIIDSIKSQLQIAAKNYNAGVGHNGGANQSRTVTNKVLTKAQIKELDKLQKRRLDILNKYRAPDANDILTAAAPGWDKLDDVLKEIDAKYGTTGSQTDSSSRGSSKAKRGKESGDKANELLRALDSRKHGKVKGLYENMSPKVFDKEATELSGKDRNRLVNFMAKNLKDFPYRGSYKGKTEREGIEKNKQHPLVVSKPVAYKPGMRVDTFNKLSNIGSGDATEFYKAKMAYEKAHPGHIIPTGVDVENFTRSLMERLKGNFPAAVTSRMNIVAQQTLQTHPRYDKERLIKAGIEFHKKYGRDPSKEELADYYIGFR